MMFENKGMALNLLFLAIALSVTLIISYFALSEAKPYVFYAICGLIVFSLSFYSIKISLAMIIISMLLSPQFAVAGNSTRTVTVKAEDIILLIIMLSWLLKIAVLKMGTITKNPLNVPIIIYCTLISISTLLGAFQGNVHPLTGMLFVSKIIEYFFIFFITVNYIHDEKDIKQLIYLMLAVCGVICLYGLYMSHSGHAVVTPFDIGKGGERNTLGGYLVLMGSLAGGMFLYSERKIEKTILLCLLILIVVTLMLSISRSGWIGFFVASFILFITTKKHKAYFVVALFFLLTLPFIVPNVVRNRFLETFNQVSQGNQVTFLGLKFDTSFSARIASIGHVFRDFSKSPFLGRGITGYYFVDGQYIRNLAEVGILGSLAFFLILFTTHGIIRNAKKILSENTQFQGIIIGLNAGFFGLLVHALSANTFIIIKICEPFWCLVGLITVATILEQERRIKNEPSYKDLVEIAHNRKLQLVNCQKKNSERVQNFVRSADIRMI